MAYPKMGQSCLPLAQFRIVMQAFFWPDYSLHFCLRRQGLPTSLLHRPKLRINEWCVVPPWQYATGNVIRSSGCFDCLMRLLIPLHANICNDPAESGVLDMPTMKGHSLKGLAHYLVVCSNILNRVKSRPGVTAGHKKHIYDY